MARSMTGFKSETSGSLYIALQCQAEQAPFFDARDRLLDLPL
jgi:hypothetical protein